MRSTNVWTKRLPTGDKAILVVAAFTAGAVSGLIRWALDLDERLTFWPATLISATFVGLVVLAVGLGLLRGR